MPRKDPEARREYNREYYRATNPDRRNPRVLRGWARPNTANPLKWKIISTRVLWEEYDVILAAKRRLAHRTLTSEMSVSAFLLYCVNEVIRDQRLASSVDNNS